eukprot:TRINITY_DN83577_c0_g1_i1.p1 TRINITY_DN83577_c0_g1~~TRINITY_DN83577_c0_g1_i1.p1  ORF type:complete len:398 (-),score=73.68 TRINITY_DN83577_c0_g1_i1:46-1239(-)
MVKHPPKKRSLDTQEKPAGKKQRGIKPEELFATPAAQTKAAIQAASTIEELPTDVQKELGLYEGIEIPFVQPKVDEFLTDDNPYSNLSKRDVGDEAVRQELELERLERLRFQNAAPQDAAGFQRLLLASPNSSYLWLQFVAFWLTGNDPERARQTCEKALQSIHFREGQELLNIWMGYLNLEQAYGTQESLRAVLNRAVQSVDQPLELYLRAADLLASSNNAFAARGVFIQACAKYPLEQRLWEANYKLCLEMGDAEGAKEVGKKALQHIPTAKHKDMLLRFAALEMKQGDVERGRSIFESLIARMPKKTDIWSIYVDLEISVRKKRCEQEMGKSVSDNTEQIRHIFERVTTLPLPAKVMQKYLTRWLTFEKEFGTDATCRAVRQRAVDYVNSKASA